MVTSSIVKNHKKGNKTFWSKLAHFGQTAYHHLESATHHNSDGSFKSEASKNDEILFNFIPIGELRTLATDQILDHETDIFSDLTVLSFVNDTTNGMKGWNTKRQQPVQKYHFAEYYSELR